MSGKHLWFAVVCVLALLAASAAAQDEKNEIGGILGRTFVSDQGIKGATYFDPIIRSGKGLTMEGEYGRRFLVTPLYAITAEVVGAYNPDEDLNCCIYPNAVIPTDYKAFFIAPAARANLFPTTAVSPWVSFGVGVGHFSEGKNLLFGGTNPGKSTTSAVIQGGLGLDVSFWRKLSARVEARDFWSGEPDFPLAATGKSRQHNFFVGGGVFWRF